MRFNALIENSNFVRLNMRWEVKQKALQLDYNMGAWFSKAGWIQLQATSIHHEVFHFQSFVTAVCVCKTQETGFEPQSFPP